MALTTTIDFFRENYEKNVTEDELQNIIKLEFIGKFEMVFPLGVFDTLVNLRYLDLSDGNTTEFEPNIFGKLINLDTLILHEIGLTVLQPDIFKNNINLYKLDLSKNKLTIIDWRVFENLTKLHTLNLNRNQISNIYVKTFVNNILLHDLDLSSNKLTEIEPNTFSHLINLRALNLTDNKLTAIEPNTFATLFNLNTLELSSNRLTVLDPNTFATLVNLNTLLICYNDLICIEDTTFVNNINLQSLWLSNNKLTEIQPNTFSTLINLTNLDVSKNNLTELPIELINLRNIRDFQYYRNPIENIHPILTRFLNRIQNRKIGRGVYTDTQSVHNHAIQESVRISVINILKESQSDTQSENLKESILLDDILTANTKALLLEYCEDKTEHSSLYITFEDLLIRVWNRIQSHPEKDELKSILNDEMKESECKCFTGRLSRLVNVLNGYFDDVTVTIQSSEQLSNVIIAVKDRLEKEGKYTVEKHREIAISELKERGYEEDIIKVWIDEIS